MAMSGQNWRFILVHRLLIGSTCLLLHLSTMLQFSACCYIVGVPGYAGPEKVDF